MIASVDGYHGGWVVALADTWPCHVSPFLTICQDFEALLAATADCQVVTEFQSLHCAVTVKGVAGLPVWGILPKLRGEPERDGRGLKMKIWF